jgi:hypothetical protein
VSLCSCTSAARVCVWLYYDSSLTASTHSLTPGAHTPCMLPLSAQTPLLCDVRF